VEAATSLWITSAIIVGVTLLIYVGLIKLGGRFVARLQSRSPGSASRVATLWVMVRRVILVVVFVLALLMILDLWGFGLSPFIAVGTVAAAAIGFGAQDVVKDLLAGFFILAEDQYHIGDTVTIAGTSGTVQDIQFRVTVLRDLEGNVHYVPNGQITVTSNFTSLYAQPVIDVGIAYGADLDRAMEVLLDVLQALADDPALRCEPPGMPSMLETPYPIEFVDEGDQIIMRFEEWDGSRTIHMNPGRGPPVQEPSLNGVSFGRFEGPTLAIFTTYISYPYYDDLGTPQSGAVTVLERYTPTADETRLDWQVTITDPATFTMPVVRRGFMAFEPGEVIKPYNCTLP